MAQHALKTLSATENIQTSITVCPHQECKAIDHIGFAVLLLYKQRNESYKDPSNSALKAQQCRYYLFNVFNAMISSQLIDSLHPVAVSNTSLGRYTLLVLDSAVT